MRNIEYASLLKICKNQQLVNSTGNRHTATVLWAFRGRSVAASFARCVQWAVVCLLE